jgi:hypothetical protein
MRGKQLARPINKCNYANAICNYTRASLDIPDLEQRN